MGTLEDTLTDVGSGMGAFLTAVQDPLVAIVLTLGVVGGVLAIFYAIATVIQRAISGAKKR
jgi:hypothetical protein